MNAKVELETESNALVLVRSEIAKIGVLENGLTLLRETYKGRIFDVATTAGMDEAKEARRAVKEPRVRTEEIRKAAKAPVLALGKWIDGEAQRITKELEALEGPIDEQIKNEERRKEQERQAKVAAELRRMTDIQERVAALRLNPFLTASAGSAIIAAEIEKIRLIAVDETFAEFQAQALQRKLETLGALDALRMAAQNHEAEEARQKTERARLDKERAEQAERDRVAREEQAARDAADKAERDRQAEAVRQSNARESERLERLRKDNERRELEHNEYVAAEDRRLATERAALEAARVPAVLPPSPKPEPVTLPEPPTAQPGVDCPRRDLLVDAVAETFDVDFDLAFGWLKAQDWT